VDFTVIVCTYNRARNLPSCLGALARQEGADAIDWEVLVVDNNSSDDTPETVERLSRELPIKVRYTREAQQGLNYARNRGITSSESTHFTFVDDDIHVSPNWLAALHQAFARTDADAVGGRIHLDPSLELPPWVVPGSEIAGFLSYQDFGDEPFRMDGRSKYPFGGNMSFHRRVVERIGLFDPKLGRRGEGRKRGELFKGAETDYFHRLAAAGDARIFYEPQAVVYHCVQPHQLQQRYFLTIHFNAGFQKALYDTRDFRRRALGIPLFLYPQLIRATAKYFGLLVTRGPNRAFRQLMTIGHFLGTMAGYRNSRKEQTA
jgi:glycosyltransferase involved in cell wall biosynthesis